MSESRQVPAFCAQCRSRCGCLAEVVDGRLTRITPLPDHPSGAQLCPKGRASAELVYHPQRLLTPLQRTAPKGAADPGWTPITWDDALDRIAAQMRSIAARGGAEQVAFSVTTPSGTQISDCIHWVERFIRAYGSPNTVYGTEICNWHKDFASRFTFGHDIGVPDFAHTDCILLWGNNPAATWLARSVEINKARRRGAGMIVVDPRPTVFARRADVWLKVRPGTDQALALGLAHLLLAENRFDRDFARQWTNAPLLVRADTGRFLRASDLEPGAPDHILYALAAHDGARLGYDSARGVWLDAGEPELFADVHVDTPVGPVRCTSALAQFAELASGFTPPRVQQLTDVDEAALRAAAATIASADRLSYYAWNGIGQSATATQTDRALSILYALTGSYGSAGGNVPGTAARFTDISGQELLTQGQRDKALGARERPLGPPRQGWITARDMYRAVLDGEPYPVRMLMSFGTNLLTSQPDGDMATRAFEALPFHVHADFFINAAAQYADIVLPVSTSWEREGLRAGFDASLQGQRRVQLRAPVIDAPGEARSDTDIVLALGSRLGLAAQMFDLDVDRGHDTMLGGAGLDVAALRAVPQGLDVASRVPERAHERLGDDGAAQGFPTPTRRIEIYSERLHEHGYEPLPSLRIEDLPATADAFPLWLGSAKTLVYCHGQHRNLPSLRKLEPDPPLDMAPTDAAHRGIAAGDWVRVITARGEMVARVRIVKALSPGYVVAQHGWWAPGAADTPYSADHPLAANFNQVVDTTVADPISGSISLRANACEVVRVDSP